MRILNTLAGCVLFAPLLSAATPTIGEILYRQGTLPSGTPVTGDRESGGSTTGHDAACVNCHRRSGLGTVEGRTVIPPITAKYLFKTGVLIVPESPIHHVESASAGRTAYTDETLARAISEGIDPDGRRLDYLMPRYKLDKESMDSLIAYLKKLSSHPAPGVTEDTLHFATIITPGADPQKRKGMLDVLERFFASKTAVFRPIPPPQRATRMTYHVPRKWQLHVWELAGEPDTWGEQLENKLRTEPVFAVISGLGAGNWAPIHRFCEQESIPCLFPNVDLPVVAEDDFYNLYFSRGVLLEAQLLSRQILEYAGKAGPKRLIQVFRENDVGVEAAKALRSELASSRLSMLDCRLKAGEGFEAALRKANAGDALVLWLRPEDIRNLPAEPPKSPAVFFSGIMGGLEDLPVPSDWRGVAQMTYPFEVAANRGVQLDYPLGWFRIQRIPIVAEHTQIDTFIACGILAENLGNMLDNFVRDYLVENIEVMLSPRIINGYYGRLGLAPGQRFASKGGYVVRFGGQDEKKLIPEGDRIIP